MLPDEKLRLLAADPFLIEGYEREIVSHLPQGAHRQGRRRACALRRLRVSGTLGLVCTIPMHKTPTA